MFPIAFFQKLSNLIVKALNYWKMKFKFERLEIFFRVYFFLFITESTGVILCIVLDLLHLENNDNRTEKKIGISQGI